MRAVLSVVMLIGFYVLGLLQLAAAGFLLYEIWTHIHGAGAVKLSWIVIAAFGAVAVGLWKAMRVKPDEPEGLIITPQQAPDLWRLVADMAREAGTRAPDEIRLVAEVNAAVSEDSKLLGLIAGTRRLYLGVPLLQTFTVDQLRSVIAHELGHYSGSHTRLAGITYRGRLALRETLSRVGKFNVAGWVFKGYGRLFLLVSNGVARRQELEADEVSVRVAGAAAATSAMREIPVVSAAWGFYFNNYISYGWERGVAPDDVFGGFRHLFAARPDELARLRDEEPDTETSRWDTHPAIGERIAAMNAMPPVNHPVDDRPADVLLPHSDQAWLALQREVVDFGDREVLPWAQFTAAATTRVVQNRADRVFRSAARLAAVPEAGLAEVLDLVAAGRLGELAAEFFPQATRKEAAAKFAGIMDDLITLAALRSGVAYWKHSWSEPVSLVDRGGAALDYAEIAKLAVNAETLDDARVRLKQAGIEVEAAKVVEAKATANGAGVIGAISNVKVDEQEHDLILLSRGFLFVPAPKGGDKGEERIGRLLSANDPAELARIYRFVPFEEVASTKIVKAVPINAELTLHDGSTVKVQERWGSDVIGESRDTLEGVLNRINERNEG
ncbi:M48 family metallopeptidase [Actinoplanes solisilvae]|uniref:M48 family metallopeptidase n=1 Tax=Actinoplanes solisilvae TaxID=2486853 RepID=UPI001F0C60F5|nr:M48 family metallopeptidase [Actinoplanes solisilvae]